VPKLLFSYDGQIGIKQFWLGLLGALASTVALAVVVGLVLGIGLIVVGASPETQEWTVWGSSIFVAGYAAFTQLAVTVKRCHARGRSGWWCLLMLIPFVGLAWLVFYLGVPHGSNDATSA
jgi:uncharacterized membrane protein YhaH (DUF805 family)